MDGTIRIKLVRSPICTPEKHKRIIKGLGLRKLNQVVERPDSPVFRGMEEGSASAGSGGVGRHKWQTSAD